MIHFLQNFANDKTCGGGGFFDLPTWYKYLKVEYSHITEKCEVQFTLMRGPERNKVFNGDDLLLVTLAIIDILIRVAALAAVLFVMYGGIKFITSQGSPEDTKNARDTILHALIGLAVAITAAAVVAFIGNRLDR